MGDKVTLQVDEREVHGKKVSNLRKTGLTPGVVYGPGIEPMSVQMPEGEVRRIVQKAGKHTPVHLTGSKRRIAMIKDVDVDPVKNTIRHISFHAVKADEPVTTEVAIRLIGQGESEAEKAGLIVLQALDRIEVRALPMELPEALEVSIASLKEEGEKITVADIVLPKGVELVEHDDGKQVDEDEDERPSITDLMIASVWEPAALEAANAAAAGSATDESEVEAENGAEETSEENSGDAIGDEAPKNDKES